VEISLGLHKPLIVNDIESMIATAIDLYSILIVSEKYRLRDREKEFFIGCVMAWRSNIGIHSKSFIEYMVNTRRFSDSEGSIYTMRNKLKNKGWVQLTAMGYDIPALFKQDLAKLRLDVLVEYNADIKLRKDGEVITEDLAHGDE